MLFSPFFVVYKQESCYRQKSDSRFINTYFYQSKNWGGGKEKWKIFLDDLYICSKAGNLNEACQASMFPVDIFQNPPF